MSTILDEVLAANAKYTENFGDKAACRCLRLGSSRS